MNTKINKDKFDKPYRVLSTYDEKKAMELFSLIEKLDTHELLKFSLSNQIPWDIQNTIGNSLIHELLLFNPEKISGLAKLPICKFLVQNGSNPDCPNKQNQTPLHIACMYQLEPIIKYLLEIGVDPNYRDNIGNTPIYYLLNGLVQSIEQDTTLGNIYQSKEKKIIDKFNTIIQIKQKLGKIINQNLPFISTITRTIENLIDIDNDTKNNFIKLQEIIIKQATKTNQDAFENVNIKTSIDLIKKNIKDKIESKFGKFKSIDNFKIHETNSTSWAHRSNKSTQSLIENGNIKKVITDDIKKNITDIKSSISSFNPDEPLNLWNTFDELLNNYVQSVSVFTTPNGNLLNYSNAGLDLDQYKTWRDRLLALDTTMKHPDCPDTWTHLIDLEKSKLMAGNINIIIEEPASYIDQFEQIINIYRNKNNSMEACVLAALCDIITSNSIETINNTDYVNWYDLKFDVLLEEPIMAGVGLYKINQGSLLFNDINTLPIDYRTDYYWYIILAWTGMFNPQNFDKLKQFNFNDENNNLVDRTFADKWIDKYNKYPLKLWLFNLYSDLFRHLNQSNLDLDMNFAFVMLCTSDLDLSNPIRSMYSAYKPHIINEIVKRKETILTPQGMEMMFMILLEESTIHNHINNVVKDLNTGEYTYDINIIKQDIQDIGELVKDYCQNKDLIIPNTSNTLDYILNTITKKYTDMKIKPLNQNWIDACFILCNYHDLPKNVNLSFDYINRVLDVENDNNNIKKIIDLLNSNEYLPSTKSILNYWLDYCQEYMSNNLLIRNYNALKLDHLMGLHYEGTCNIEVLRDLSLIGTTIKSGRNNIDIKLCQNNEHDVTLNNFGAIQILSPNNGTTPLPFGNLFFTGVLNKDEKIYFNNIKDINRFPNTIKSPIDGSDIGFEDVMLSMNTFIAITKDTYEAKLKNTEDKYNIILKIILNKVNNIINDLSNEKTTRLGEIYITYIHSIIKIITLSKSKYNLKELIKNLNSINSNYYLYYYIYTPSQLIKLSRFNYWQIPESAVPDNYQYWDDETTELKFELTPEIGIIESNIPKTSKGLLNFYSHISNRYTLINLTKEDFKRLKSSSLPPSLYARLEDFYKYIVIELSKYIIEKIDTGKAVGVEKEIYDLTYSLLHQTNVVPDIGNRDLLIYNIICKILEELVKNVIDSNITKYVSDFYLKTLSAISPDNIKPLVLAPIDIDFTEPIINVNQLAIHLGKTNIDFDKITKTQDVKNLLNVVVEPNNNSFILYPNDFTITTKYLNKSKIVINPNIIKLLIQHHSTPDLNNFDGISPFTSIIKTYNYPVIEEFKKYGIDFRFSDINKILINEVNENISKVLGENNSLDKVSHSSIKSILNNIYTHHTSEISNLINSNLDFKNNIPLNLDTSFAICSHITLQYMSELLLKINPEFTFENLTDLFKLVNPKLNPTSLVINRLDEIAERLDVPDDVNSLFLLNILENKVKEYSIISNSETKLINTIKNLEPTLKLKIEKTDLAVLQQKSLLLDSEIKNINGLLGGVSMVKSVINTDEDIVDRYEKLPYHPSILFELWNKYINSKISLNPNLLILQIYGQLNGLVDEFKSVPIALNLENIKKISIGLNQISKHLETYFNEPQFTKYNSMYKNSLHIISYLTKIFIGNSIEMTMRKVLFTYFNNSENDINKINDKIKIVLELELSTLQMSMVDILYKKIVPSIVKNCSEMYSSPEEKIGWDKNSVKNILMEFFDMFKYSPIPINDELITSVFIEKIANYYDVVCTKCISYWIISIENIYKHFINVNRNIKALINLIE